MSQTLQARRTLIAAMDEQSLLALISKGDPDDRAMAASELNLRGGGSVMDASARLLAAADRFTALDAVAALDLELAGEQALDRELSQR